MNHRAVIQFASIACARTRSVATALLALAALLATPSAAFAVTKPDVWKVVSIKVHGQDALQGPQNQWKGPIQASFPNSVNVEVVWEPGNGLWSHLADQCHPWPTITPHTSKLPQAYLSNAVAGAATIIDTADNQITYTYQVPKDAEFYVWLKCEAVFFSNPPPDLNSTFAFVNLKHQISVSAADLDAGGFDPYGMPEAPSIEVSMPGDPGKFPSNDTSSDYKIFISHTAPAAPQQIRGQYQRAVKYQYGGVQGDLAMPSGKVYVSQWTNVSGPVDNPTAWNSLAYGGPSKTKGVSTPMGNGSQFPTGIYRFRAKAEDGSLQGWSGWWMFIVGNPQTTQMMSAGSTAQPAKMVSGSSMSQFGKGNMQSKFGKVFPKAPGTNAMGSQTRATTKKWTVVQPSSQPSNTKGRATIAPKATAKPGASTAAPAGAIAPSKTLAPTSQPKRLMRNPILEH